VILVDANVVLHAYDDRSPLHPQSRHWFERTLSEEPDVRFPLTTILAFLRIGTNLAVYEQPRTPAEAVAIVSAWLTRPNVQLANPTDRHWALLGELATEANARGPLLMDAHVAALAVEHGALLATLDRDFRRFPGARLISPIPVET
jgi:toxin-antitoxin system PIN domain toxin